MTKRIEIDSQTFALAELHENGLSVSFKVFKAYQQDDPDEIADGFVKWDGCSNWVLGPGYMHFCDEDDERAFGEMLVKLRREALVMMGDKAIFTVGP